MKTGLDPHGPVHSTASSPLVLALVETGAVTAATLAVALHFDWALAWLLVPLAIVAFRRESPAQIGLDVRLRPPSLRFHVCFGALLLAAYTAGHVAVARVVLHRSFALRLPSRPILDVARELLTVGIPEETFFRGYVQARWNHVAGRPWRFLDASVGPAILVQSAAFALCHLATGDWRRLSVFFFALLAGWLRERSGSIFPPALYHAVANVWVRALAASFH